MPASDMLVRGQHACLSLSFGAVWSAEAPRNISWGGKWLTGAYQDDTSRQHAQSPAKTLC